ncbi:hypothetical protein [Streptomyces flaveolus]|uniref:hypothetical protein n=1 Tax=Streptomyces flaveolus TaxID=67297 RepID=UPI00340740AF
MSSQKPRDEESIAGHARRYFSAAAPFLIPWRGRTTSSGYYAVIGTAPPGSGRAPAREASPETAT